MGNPTVYVDEAVSTIRSGELPNASFNTGMNAGGSNAPGIGINAGEGAVVGTAAQFSLLDQASAARTPQTSQFIGGEPLGAGKAGLLPGNPIFVVTNSSSGDGNATATGNAHLATLNAGWVAV